MPYIAPEERPQFSNILKQIKNISTKGQLEFCIFYLQLKYMSTREKRYSNYHDTTYAAAHCADEFKRRFLDKREDQAIIENGDIEIE